MALSWNEIKQRAVQFASEYANAKQENAETHSFYNDFFHVFGISRRRVASFEAPVKKLGDKKGRMDLFWKGMLVAEQKSAGRDLVKAKEQALDYFPHLKEYELPRYLMISDFQTLELHDLEEKTEIRFPLQELHLNIEHFGFIAGYTKRKFEDQEPVNIEAANLIGDLHDSLVENGYYGIELERFLIRILFCLFSDNTGIFEKHLFKFYIEEKSSEDGSNIGSLLEGLFQTLNQKKEKRPKNMDEDLAKFPYINGDLFAGYLPLFSFDSNMRTQMLKCCHFDWSRISPAIFGAMFQAATDQNKRRSLGAHYTSEQNILKVIQPLFMDELTAQFEKIKHNKNKLAEFHAKIAKLTFLDPACGCGNFLIIAYRELRLLEIKIIHELFSNQLELDVAKFVHVNINQFYGIEIEELPAKIAEVAMWLVDHQMNMKLSEAFGQYFARIPLSSSANIRVGNALRMDWKDIIPPQHLHYILGNPPFIGSKFMDDRQREDMKRVFSEIKGAGILDYVTAWHVVASRYIQGTHIKVGFVSTNSIAQGEQVGILWNILFSHYHIKIHFAHRTFAWKNEAKGNAAVFCIIIGFASFDGDNKTIYEYENPKDDFPKAVSVTNINPYLVNASDVTITSRHLPLCDVPEMGIGNKPIDDGNYLFDEVEKNAFIQKEPSAEKYFRNWLGGDELMSGKKRFCLYLKDAAPNELQKMPEVLKRIKAVKQFRLASKSIPTQNIANIPTRFHVENTPTGHFIVVSKVSTSNREYLPFAIIKDDTICSDLLNIIPSSSLYLLGILSSKTHMSWLKYVCGRLGNAYRYSTNIVYNNFPFPKNPTKQQIKKIEEKAQKILDTRALYPTSSLADLYHPLTMPKELVKAHNELDKAVDAAYGKNSFKTEQERIAFLFALYQDYTTPLLGQEKQKRRKNQ